MAKNSPILEEFGIQIKKHPDCSIHLVLHSDIRNFLAKMSPKFVKKFNELASGQTMSIHGMFWYDVEKILQQIQSNKEYKDWD